MPGISRCTAEAYLVQGESFVQQQVAAFDRLNLGKLIGNGGKLAKALHTFTQAGQHRAGPL